MHHPGADPARQAGRTGAYGSARERVTAAQYLLVANVLIGNGIDTDRGWRLLDSAIATARDVNDYVSAARVKAFRIFQLGSDRGGSRAVPARAARLRNQRCCGSSRTTFFQDYTHLQTHVGWAQAELSVGNCDEAQAQSTRRATCAPAFGANDTQVRRMEAVAVALAGLSTGRDHPVARSPSPIVP